MTIGVFVDGKIVQRPYSVASAPGVAGDTGYEFYLRLVQGGTFTPLLWDLPVGHRMRMIGPKGKFMLEPDDDRTHLFISSGTGNAPFVSMMRQLLLDGRAAAGRVPQRRFVRPTSSATATSLEGWQASGEYPVTLHPDRLAARRPAQRRLDGPDRPRRDDPRRRSSTSSACTRTTRSPTSAATRT